MVDIDVKGFFDNINHAKLLKQLWALGIRDKSLLKVISKMLKAEIEGVGIPEKGTPQGGIPVSYTPLDVYKRQAEATAPPKYQAHRWDSSRCLRTTRRW